MTIIQSVGAQTDKFEKKLEKSIRKQKDLVFLCDVPYQNFRAGEYTIKMDTVSATQLEYTAIKDNVLVARVKIYDSNIIKIEPKKK